MNPIDLQTTYGRRYRIEREQPGRDPWNLRIPCDAGHVYPHSDTHLAYSSDRRGPIANRVAALPGAQIVQDGADGLNITFPAALFDRVAEIVRPRRRRRLSDEQRQAAADRLREFQFSAARQSNGAEQESPDAT